MTKDDVFPLVAGGIGVSFSEEVLHDDKITITRLQEV